MKKRLIAASAIVFAVALMLTLCLAVAPFAANAEQWSDVEFKQAYPYGTQLNVPQRKITVGNSSADAVSVVVSPDGDATLNTQVALDVVGVYSVIYTAQIGNQTYRSDESFEVYDSVARVGEYSTYSYGAYKDTDVNGLKVSLASGDEIAFSNIVDLRNATKSEPIIELFAAPSKTGVMDYEQIVVTFTDIENPDCYLRVRGRQSLDGIQSPNTYWLAGGNDQPMAGWEGGNWNKLHVNDEWGAPTRHSFYGYYPDDPSITPEQVQISIRYDAATRCVYSGDTMIIDLDNSLYFSTLWDGFTSGKVRVTVSADYYTATKADFVVTHLQGVDLSADKLVDDVPPEITVDTPYKTAPTAKVGVEYPIPNALAKDDYSGTRNVERHVWYNFNSSNAATVTELGGCFVPQDEGLYAIVYNSSDRMNNIAQKIIWVNAVKELAPITISLSNKTEQARAGEYVNIADYSVSGGSGTPEVKIEVTLNGSAIECSNRFRPDREGNYVVKYVARDYLGQTAEESYTVVVSKGDKPIFIDEPILPRYYISGSEYSVPELYAYDYSSGTEQKIKATVTVTDANGENRTVNGTFTPLVINNGEEVTLTFTAGSAEPIVRKIKAIKSFEADNGRMRLQMQNYFVPNNVQVQAEDDCVTVTSLGAAASFDFANTLLADGTTLQLRAVPARSQFDGIKVTLTDSIDGSQSVSLTIYKNGRSSYVIADGVRIELTSGFHTASVSNSIGFTYLSGKLSFGSSSVDIKKYDDGSAFAGFSSQFIYLTVTFVNPSPNAAISVTDVNDQPVSNGATDRIRPKINLLGRYGDVATLNSVQTLPRAIAGDVLDPNVTLTLTVLDKSGTAVKANDGTVLQNVSTEREYMFNASEYGQYSISYVASDTFNGKDYVFGYVINVEDREKPTVKFATEIVSEIKLGETIVIPDFTVDDNVTEADKLIVAKYVCTPSGRIEVIPEHSNAFRPTTAGVYEVRITVTDAAGNTALARLTVTVTQ